MRRLRHSRAALSRSSREKLLVRIASRIFCEWASFSRMTPVAGDCQMPSDHHNNREKNDEQSVDVSYLARSALASRWRSTSSYSQQATCVSDVGFQAVPRLARSGVCLRRAKRGPSWTSKARDDLVGAELESARHNFGGAEGRHHDYRACWREFSDCGEQVEVV